jgi:hypothetical protein
MGVGTKQVRGVVVLACLLMGTVCRWGLGGQGGAGAVRPERVSLEWGVERAELIVRGTVGPGGQADVSIDGRDWREVTLDVAETIKGWPRGSLVFRMRPGEGLAKEGGGWSDVLVFLKWVSADARANAPSAGLGEWEAEEGGVFVLGDKRPGVVRMDGVEVADGEALLKGVREAAAFANKRGGKPAPYTLRDGDDRRVVPLDGRLLPIARRWIEKGGFEGKFRGVSLVAELKTPESAALLQKLKSDPYYVIEDATSWSPEPAQRAVRQYTVRLMVEAVASPDPVGMTTAPEQRYGAVAWRGWGLALGVVVVMALVWPGKLGVGGRLALSLAGVMVLVGVEGWRTRAVAETYCVAGGGVDYEVVTGGWRVGLLRVQDDAPRHGWMVRRYGVGQGAWLWFEGLMWPVEEKRVAGVYVGEGKTRDSSAYPFRLVRLD